LLYRLTQWCAEIVAAYGLAADDPDMLGQNPQSIGETKHAFWIGLMQIDSVAVRVFFAQPFKVRLKDINLARRAAAVERIDNDKCIETVHKPLDERNAGDAAFEKLNAPNLHLALQQAKRFDSEPVIASQYISNASN
jgi:hypothetical protein